ncbi:Cbt1p NDAI_0D01530 [Naumovozyma dairenensis CBS 421]|uniref:Uncharacterized protein n=1 Tax=Naumovozyma dairenensis (strain ATCC 10597 / BCRC 20456 / CBS 421 / NBRC 0211 / NRRL Y-12639) TaxID=1071378 RepID=G0W9K6_NAUDC|nr:hypothetical protein NDAI_0D01530 [Naumovozyma dairenensis CBS 421]CCD24467.1 hypothetical protein NDAI_0D01530 [Naumovozyma dairenensis CBS 421]
MPKIPFTTSFKQKNRVLFKGVKVPKFVQWSERNQKNDFQHLERQIEKDIAFKRYTTYLSEFNTFFIFTWRTKEDYILNKDYYWNLFFRKGFNSGSLNSKIGSLFLSQRLNNTVFQKCLKIDFLKPRTEYRLFLQNNTDVEGLEEVINYTQTNRDLQLHCVGMNVNPHAKSPMLGTLKYIQPLLEESNNLYKNIDYLKLLEIAKMQPSDEPGKVKIKYLLQLLAKSKLSSPKLVDDGRYLIFC